MVENIRQKVYELRATVKAVEERFTTKYAGGVGKDARTTEVSDGWWITFEDYRSAVRCETKPDCQPGDKALCTWEFRRP